MSIPDAVKAFAISVVRTTLVPLIVGWLGVLAVKANTDLDPELVPALVTGFGIAYYVIVRWFEDKVKWAGLFLIIPRSPTYTANDLRGFADSLRRTIIPLADGLAITTLAKLGLTVSAEGAALLTIAITTAYYGLFRSLEEKFPAASIPLGGGSAPSYEKDNGERAGGD